MGALHGVLCGVVCSLLGLASVLAATAPADRAAPGPLLGLPTPVPRPATNPPGDASELGRRLFFDPRLSVNDTMSCAMCHIPTQGFTSNELRLAVGINGRSARRNAPSLYNVAYQRSMFHDGRVATLEEQIPFPLTHPAEMGNASIDDVVTRLRAIPDYRRSFRDAFGTDVTGDALASAIASYERTLVSADSPFDRWYFGRQEGAVDADVKRGFGIFSGRGGCIACHTVENSSALFTNHRFHNTGVHGIALIPDTAIDIELAPGLTIAMPRAQLDTILDSVKEDLGRYEFTGDVLDVGRYKTPSLRNVALTAPYMHNGVFLTLHEVIDYYDQGGTGAEGQDPRLRPLGLTDTEKGALHAFLLSLTGSNVEHLARSATRPYSR
jgi:cytochrome c peroxidase